MKVAVVCLVIVLSITIHAIECNVNNLRLSNTDLPIDGYKKFLKNFRLSLHSGAYTKNNVPVMRRSVQDSKRFYMIYLTGANDETITAAIDVLDASIAAYCAGERSYFFSNAPQLAYQILFTNTTKKDMEFDNTFSSLEKAAGITRSLLPLGVEAFDVAIASLFNHELVPESFLVIIQMFIEASKFRFIAQHVVNSLRDGKAVLPSRAILSLEDNWSELSLQIQASESLQGLFGKEVLLYNSNDEPIKVDSIHYPIVTGNLAYQLHTCFDSIMQNQDNNNRIIKMPGSVNDDHNQKKNKCIVEPKTLRISGRDGKCVDVARALVADGAQVILYPCGEQVNQKWTFYPDKTVRSLGKCLTGVNTPNYGSPVVIYDCDKVSKEEVEWRVTSSGRFVRYYSYLEVALTARSRSTISTNLTEEYDGFTADQTWRVGNYVKPFIISIVGLNDMCLEATNGNTEISLEDCVKNKKEQTWAMYSDGTIRVNENRSLCVASTSVDGSSKAVVIDTCTGLYKERWHLSEGKITNGNGYFVLDVLKENDGYLKKIILNNVSYQDSQEWVLLY